MKADILDWIALFGFVAIIAGLEAAAQGMANSGNLTEVVDD